jgi:hypothetical protein
LPPLLSLTGLLATSGLSLVSWALQSQGFCPKTLVIVVRFLCSLFPCFSPILPLSFSCSISFPSNIINVALCAPALKLCP